MFLKGTCGHGCPAAPAHLVRSRRIGMAFFCGCHALEEFTQAADEGHAVTVEPITAAGDLVRMNALLHLAWSTSASSGARPRSSVLS